MPIYVFVRRALHGHTTVWYEPLEDGNVGHGGCLKVTGDLQGRAASKIMTVNFDVRDCVVAASWCGPDRHHLRRAASPAPHFKRRGRASVELDGARSCSCCEVRLSALTRR